MAQNWSTGQLEQLRKFLQTASQIPSPNSIQDVLQSNAPKVRPPFQSYSQNIAGEYGSKLKAQRETSSTTQPSQNANAAGSSRVSSAELRPVPDGFSGIKYPSPDVKSMLFDVATGCRFDQSTGLYYEANAGLFVNKQLNVLLRWNPATSTYLLVGRASDVAAPALAQDLARLVEHGQIRVPYPSLPIAPDPTPSSLSSSTDHIRDTTFRKDNKSSDYEDMTPEREGDFSYRIGPSSPERSPDLSKYDVAGGRGRSRSLSFEEMTPEPEDLPSVSVFPRKNRSPSHGRSPLRYSSRSPIGGDPERHQSGTRESQDRDYYERVGHVGRKSPRLEHSRSPKRNHSGSPSSGPSRRRFSPVESSKRRSSPSRRSSPPGQYRKDRRKGVSPKRGSKLSSSPLRSRTRRLSPERSRRHSSARASWRSSNREPRQRSRSGSPDCDERYGDWGGRRFHGSPSPTHQFERRRGHSERGQTLKYSRRSRSRSPYNSSKTKSRRSTSRTRASFSDKRENSHSSSRQADKSVKAKQEPEAEPSDSEPGPAFRNQQKGIPSEGPSTGGESVQAAAVPSITSAATGFSRRFMMDNINRIHKNNLRKPGNIYGQLLPPNRTSTNFIMLTPLPQKGDREWEDLETLLKRVLDDEGVSYISLVVYPGDGGAPCNYCLIKFMNPDEAFRWYMLREGTIDLSSEDGSTCTVFMNFIQNNWKCRICKVQNFSLRHFCYKCFWDMTNSKGAIQISQLVTEYVGIGGLDCRFLSPKEVLVGLPPLDSFDIESFELLAEPTGIPVGLCVFKFKDIQESGLFYRFLQESCLNPIFVNLVSRRGLGVNPVEGHLIKGIVPAGKSSNAPPPSAKETSVVETPKMDIIVFPNPPEAYLDNCNSLWWQSVAGYVPEEGGDMMKYLFEGHREVRLAFESAPAQILIGPLPIPLACDLMEYRDLLSRFLQSTGVSERNTGKTSICKSHHFGAPYNYAFVRFDNKIQTKEWLEKNKGKLVLHLENGSTWPAYLHYSKPNWSCVHCHRLNFPIRIQCFSCYKSRLSDHTPVSLKKTPTISIGITGYQNWCATEELLFKKLPFLRDMKNLTVSYLKEPTGVPLGICVLKSATPAASEILFNKLQDALTNEIARANIQEPNRPLLAYLV